MKEINHTIDSICDSALTIAAENLSESLQAKNFTLATVESCTGGWVAKCLTDLPGSSAWFDRSFVTYSNQAKQDMLGVDANTLAQHGAVSERTVTAMLEGVFVHSPVDVALAISGIAGPTGGSADKPVGLVWFGWGRREEGINTEAIIFNGDRDKVRRSAVLHALNEMTALTGF